MTHTMGYTGNSTSKRKFSTFREFNEAQEDRVERQLTQDSGFFYCPYIPLMSCGTVIDGNTVQKSGPVNLTTRYGNIVAHNAP